MSTEAQWAWAAGLFEGEGCIYAPTTAIRTHNRSLLCIRMTDLDVLQRFHEIVGVGAVKPVPHGATWQPHWKDAWTWRVDRWVDIVAVCARLEPWLGARRLAKMREILARPRRAPTDPRKTHCKRGHPLSGPGSDVLIKRLPDGTQRQCRLCGRVRRAEKKRQRVSA